MNRLNLKWLVFISIVWALMACNVPPKTENPSKLEFLPFAEVSVTDNFWKPKIDTALQVTVPHIMKMCLEAGYVDNFAIVAGLKDGEYKGLRLWDETLYKAIEAASYSLKLKYNSDLDSMLDSIIA